MNKKENVTHHFSSFSIDNLLHKNDTTTKTEENCENKLNSNKKINFKIEDNITDFKNTLKNNCGKTLYDLSVPPDVNNSSGDSDTDFDVDIEGSDSESVTSHISDFSMSSDPVLNTDQTDHHSPSSSGKFSLFTDLHSETGKKIHVNLQIFKEDARKGIVFFV